MPQSKSQLLIVDDYPTNIKVLSDLLIEYGFEVLIARDGENALQKLQRITPDLILLDVLMPGIDGFETCRRLKEHPSNCHIPVIFMTALTDPVDKIKGLTMGAVDYITKPFQQEEVLARVNTHLRLRHLSQQLADRNAQLQAEARSRQLAEVALRASEEKFVKAFRSNPGPIMIATLADGQILEANEAFCRILGYPIDSILNQRLQELPLFANEADHDRFFAAMRGQNSICNFECQLHTTTGENRCCLISAEIIAVREQPCILAMMVDITDCQQAAIALQQAKDAAELANQAKTRFLSHISHELRTPLNTILGYTHLLERDQALKAEQQSYLETISRSGQHLLALINDVLEMTKIESGQIGLHPTICDLPNLLQTLKSMLAPKALEKNLQLTLSLTPTVPPYVQVDQTKLRQILLNLLSNGIKFTDEGHVSLIIDAAPPDTAADRSATLLFAIADTGAGIAASELDSLFDPFVQSELGRLAQEGAGLGLSISQQFVTLMGGQLTVESTVGVGSVFRFSLPVGLPPGDAVVSPPRHRVIGLADHQPQYRLLIVEDQASSRDLLIKLLSLVGFQVRAATDGAAAIAEYQQWHPHLILMDIHMPRLDGYEAIRQIRALAAEQTQPLEESSAGPAVSDQAVLSPKIIALTASAFEEERRAAYAAGCDDFISKPLQEAELLTSIANQLGATYVYEALPSDPDQAATAGTSQGLADAVMADLLDLVSDDQVFLLEYLQMHIEQIPLLLNELQGAIAQADAVTLGRAAHTLKSIGLTFADQAFASACLEIEKLAAQGTTAMDPALVQSLETSLNQLLTQIRETAASLDPV